MPFHLFQLLVRSFEYHFIDYPFILSVLRPVCANGRVRTDLRFGMKIAPGKEELSLWNRECEELCPMSELQLSAVDTGDRTWREISGSSTMLSSRPYVIRTPLH